MGRAISDFKRSAQAGQAAARRYKWLVVAVAVGIILVRAYLRGGILFPAICGAIVAIFLFLNWYHRSN